MSKILSLDPKKLSLSELHGYLLAAVVPRPIALASTIDENGRVNLSPFSFFNVFSANPPVAIFSPARSGRNNSIKHTLENIQKIPEVVINLVTYAMVEQASLASAPYPKGVNEFHKSGLTAADSDLVKPPRVVESPVAFECKVTQEIPLGDQGGAGNLVISEVIKIHLKSEYLDMDNSLMTNKLDLVGRMGGEFYIRAFGDALFRLPKPAGVGIGVDQLPKSVRKSSILTGNDLAKLGGLLQFPDETAVSQWKSRDAIQAVLEKTDALDELHQDAKRLISNEQIEEALKTLLVADKLAAG